MASNKTNRRLNILKRDPNDPERREALKVAMQKLQKRFGKDKVYRLGDHKSGDLE